MFRTLYMTPQKNMNKSGNEKNWTLTVIQIPVSDKLDYNLSPYKYFSKPSLSNFILFSNFSMFYLNYFTFCDKICFEIIHFMQC